MPLATFLVSNLNDDGVGSLRHAISDANASPGLDEVVFDPTLTGRVDFLGGEISIAGSVHIQGPGHQQVILDGRYRSRLFYIDDGDEFTQQHVTISGLELTSGYADKGGAIYTKEHLTLTDTQLSQHTAVRSGGAIEIRGANLLITNAELSRNSALGDFSGGGGAINAEDGTVTLSSATVADNRSNGSGGAIASNGDVAIAASTFTGNFSTDSGGALFSNRPPSVTIADSQFINNQARNRGGAVFVNDAGDTTIDRSLLSGNEVVYQYGGAIWHSEGTLTISESTLAENSAWRRGGGVFQLRGSLTLTDSVVKQNTTHAQGGSGGGINMTSGSLSIDRSIIEHNRTFGQAASGGGIYFSTRDKASLSLTDVTIRNNMTFGRNATGGGLFLDLDFSTEVTLDGLLISSNETRGAGAIGGGVYVDGSSMTAHRLQIMNNRTTGRFTGGAGLGTDRSITLYDSVISGNQTLGPDAYGGGVLDRSGVSTITLVNTSVNSNSSSASGGGVSAASVVATSSKIMANESRLQGGGIHATRGMQLNDTTLSENLIRQSDLGTFDRGTGGGAYVDGSVTIIDSTISGNSIDSTSAALGGGLFLTGNGVILRSEITHNSIGPSGTIGGGAGIASLDNPYEPLAYPVRIQDSIVSSNDALTRKGGGLLLENSNALIERSVFKGNRAAAGGAINADESTVALDDSLLSGNTSYGDGGAVHAEDSETSIRDSTIAGNVATSLETIVRGGGIWFSDLSDSYLLTLVNSTVSGNSAFTGGGLNVSSGEAIVSYSTFTENLSLANQGSAIATGLAGETQLRSTIASGNSPGDLLGFAGTLISNGYNLVGSGSTNAFVEPGDQAGIVSPGLGPLSFNGGITPTHGVLPDSPAIDAGPMIPTAAPPHDQRGLGYPRIFNNRIDVGSIESQPSQAVPDFDGDGQLGIADLDLLMADLAAAVQNLAVYDLNSDGMVDLLDRDFWLARAGAINLPGGQSYRPGDANLDGNVDGQDFVIWNANKFALTGLWSAGDFDGNGTTDGQDFIAWNSNRFQSSTAASAPPLEAKDEEQEHGRGTRRSKVHTEFFFSRLA